MGQLITQAMSHNKATKVNITSSMYLVVISFISFLYHLIRVVGCDKIFN